MPVGRMQHMPSDIPAEPLSALQQHHPQDRPLWVVDVSAQTICAIQADGRVDSAPVSTSRFGVGNEPGSYRTPTGWHQIAEVIGVGAPLGQRFESRTPVGDPLTTWTGGRGDAILSRILWLEGLEPEKNHHSHSRYIYIHGTHQEELLGTPASHGCIRMGNRTLAQWTDSLTKPYPRVWIGCVKKE